MVVTEHGVYVREAYLAAVRGRDSPGGRFRRNPSRPRPGARVVRRRDVVSPVTEANAVWEQGLGVDPEKILVLRNGLQSSGLPEPPPKRTVVSIGRIDPLKDVHTMLRVADETLDRVPDATFLHFGPVTDGEEAYARSCSTLHTRLGLGNRFRFMGRTTDPNGVIRDADVVLMTSISEGLPMSILEAMSEARPVVSTGVGGVPDVVKGCGIVTPPGDTFALSMGVTTLLRNPDLAWRLGRRGHRRLHRVFDEAFCLDGYRELLITAAHPSARMAGAAVEHRRPRNPAGRGHRRGSPRTQAAGHARGRGRARGLGRGAGGRSTRRRSSASPSERRETPAEHRQAAHPAPGGPRARGGRVHRGHGRHRLLGGAARRRPRREPRGERAAHRPPLTVALQWGVNSRYLSRPKGTVLSAGTRGHRARRRRAHPRAGGVFGRSGLVAGLLTVTWTGGTILIASRLSDGYVGLVLLATMGMFAGLSPSRCWQARPQPPP